MEFNPWKARLDKIVELLVTLEGEWGLGPVVGVLREVSLPGDIIAHTARRGYKREASRWASGLAGHLSPYQRGELIGQLFAVGVDLDEVELDETGETDWKTAVQKAAFYSAIEERGLLK